MVFRADDKLRAPLAVADVVLDGRRGDFNGSTLSEIASRTLFAVLHRGGDRG